MIEVLCAFCGETTKKAPSRIKRNNKHFCSKECELKWRESRYVIVKCDNCGKDKRILKSIHFNQQHTFCSRKCKGEFKTKSGRTAVNCANCNNELHRINWRVKENNNQFCDKQCYIEYQVKNDSPLKMSFEIPCDWCGESKEVTPYDFNNKNNHFCSIECYNKFQRGGDNIIVECEFCGTAKEITRFTFNRSTTGFFFCDPICQAKWQVDFFKRCNNPNWKGGLSFGEYGSDFNKELKNKVRERDNHTCQICGTTENGRLLNVHHIDYDKMNNKEKNLISLCDSCHPITNGNRGYWQEYLTTLMNRKYRQVVFA